MTTLPQNDYLAGIDVKPASNKNINPVSLPCAINALMELHTSLCIHLMLHSAPCDKYYPRLDRLAA